MLYQIRKELRQLADADQAGVSQGFFKTGVGEYGEGDVFLGIKVPVLRKVAVKYNDLTFRDLKALLDSKIHEFRFVALVILLHKYKKGDMAVREKIYRFYLKNTRRINNWDLVDVSAHAIVGDYLKDKPRVVLYELAASKNLWERRIAIIATLAFIRGHDFSDTLKLSAILLKDEEDLINKAVGWMLRELGKKSKTGKKELLGFLDKYIREMPRVTLRYAIERFNERERKRYLSLK